MLRIVSLFLIGIASVFITKFCGCRYGLIGGAALLILEWMAEEIVENSKK